MNSKRSFSIMVTLVVLLLSACDTAQPDSATATPTRGTSSKIIMMRGKANLSGNPDYDDAYTSIVMYDLVTKTLDVLAESDGATITHAASAVSPDGKTLYLETASLVQTSTGERWNGLLYQMDLQTRKLTRLSSSPEYSGEVDGDNLIYESLPDISNDGTLLAFNSNRDNLSATSFITELYIMNMRDLSIRRVRDTPLGASWNAPTYASRAKFSPDDTKIAFMGWDGSDWEIYIIGIDGKGLKTITRNSSDDRFPDWSPDGSKLVFHSDMSGNFELYTYDLSSKETIQVTSNPAIDASANWSPDGSMLLFESDRDGDSDIYAITLASGEEIEIYHDDDIGEYKPLWVP